MELLNQYDSFRRIVLIRMKRVQKYLLMHKKSIYWFASSCYQGKSKILIKGNGSKTPKKIGSTCNVEFLTLSFSNRFSNGWRTFYRRTWNLSHNKQRIIIIANGRFDCINEQKNILTWWSKTSPLNGRMFHVQIQFKVTKCIEL